MKFVSVFGKSFSAAALCLPALAGAFCGLQSCPRVGPHGGSFPFEAGARSRLVAFDIAGEQGYYGVFSPRFFAKALGLSLGAEVPWVNLHTAAGVTSGLGNPLLIAQYARPFSPAWTAQAGVQWELPFGDTDHGLAGDHAMLLPWVGARHELGASWHLSGMLGFSYAIEEPITEDEAGVAPLAKAAHNGVDHGSGEAAPLFVNPHGDREAQWRLGVGRALARRWMLEAFALGQADLTGSNAVFYTRAGASAEWMATSSVGLQFIADAPVTAARRSEAALGADVKIMW
jgi:hypothetical protein